MKFPVAAEIQRDTVGAFRMAWDDYAKAPGLSKSKLDPFFVSPARYRAIADGLIERKASDEMNFGNLVHSLVLENRADFYEQPAEIGGKPWRGSRTECKAWKAEHADKIILDSAEVNELHTIRDAVRSHPFCSALLAAGAPEISLFGNIQGRAVKGRADWIGDGYIVDLKTTRDASTRAFSREILQRRYHVQAALYQILCNQAGLKVDRYYFIAVEKGQVPQINVRRLATSAVELGAETLNRTIKRLLECEQSKLWPDYSTSDAGWSDPDDALGIRQIDVPEWAYSDDVPELIGAEPANFEHDEDDIIP